jgi:hypothetical protein
MSATPDTTTSGGLANINHQVSDKGKVARKNPWHHDGMTFHQEEQMLPKSWILLDNQSTVDVFCNRHQLTNIRETNKVMNFRCNTRVTRTNMVGELNGYGTVWYNSKGIANILSLSQVEKKHRVTYDSAVSKAFIVHKNDGSKRRFQQATSGLFYMDTELTSVQC